MKGPLHILECVGHPSFKHGGKKQKRDFVKVFRECVAKEIPGESWMKYNKKWTPMGVYAEDNTVVRLEKECEMHMKICWEGFPDSGEIHTPPMTATYWFSGVEFSKPGKCELTFSMPRAKEFGYDVAPFVIPITVLEPPPVENNPSSTPSAKESMHKLLMPRSAPSSSGVVTVGASSSSSSSCSHVSTEGIGGKRRSTIGNDALSSTRARRPRPEDGVDGSSSSTKEAARTQSSTGAGTGTPTTAKVLSSPRARQRSQAKGEVDKQAAVRLGRVSFVYVILTCLSFIGHRGGGGRGGQEDRSSLFTEEKERRFRDRDRGEKGITS